MSEKHLANLDQIRVAKNLRAMRAQRSKFFPSNLFDEHAWTLLLHLYINKIEGARHSDEKLFSLVGVTAFVGQRWISHLLDDGQIGIDAETRCIVITDDAYARMRSFLLIEGRERIRDS